MIYEFCSFCGLDLALNGPQTLPHLQKSFVSVVRFDLKWSSDPAISSRQHAICGFCCFGSPDLTLNGQLDPGSNMIH